MIQSLPKVLSSCFSYGFWQVHTAMHLLLKCWMEKLHCPCIPIFHSSPCPLKELFMLLLPLLSSIGLRQLVAPQTGYVHLARCILKLNLYFHVWVVHSVVTESDVLRSKELSFYLFIHQMTPWWFPSLVIVDKAAVSVSVQGLCGQRFSVYLNQCPGPYDKNILSFKRYCWIVSHSERKHWVIEFVLLSVCVCLCCHQFVLFCVLITYDMGPLFMCLLFVCFGKLSAQIFCSF